ncbi:MAG: PIN domain-containing protein [Methanosarcinales archaeon]
MRLVVDANVLFSFFKKESKTRRLILNFEILEPVTPSFCIEELNKHKRRDASVAKAMIESSFCIEELNKHKRLICEKSKLSDSEFEEVLNDLLISVKVFSLSEYRESLSDAKTISPDPDDIDLFALALKLNCPIWSQEKTFKSQSRIKVFSTFDLLSILSPI